MKPSRHFPLLALLLCAPASTHARAPDKSAQTPAAVSTPAEPRVQLGVFEGTGRACSGLLKVTPKRLSWSPPFSPCPPSTYTLAERRQEHGATRWAYRLVGAPKSCTYKVVVLEKKLVASDNRIAWNALSYTSMQAYKADSDVRLACYLIKIK
jgi:hypothetical protein